MTSRLSLSLIAIGLLASCTQKTASHQTRPTPGAGLSSEENQYIEAIEKGDDAQQNVSLVAYTSDSQNIPDSVKPYLTSSSQGLTEFNVPASKVRAVEAAILRANQQSVVTLNLFAEVERTDPGLEANEQLLFSGKEEFGIQEWSQKYPQADGRDVKISIVDDGLSLGRPGLLTTSQGTPKIVRSINTSPLWQIPVVKQPSACTTSLPASHAASESKNWKVESTANLPPLTEASFQLPFDISP